MLAVFGDDMAGDHAAVVVDDLPTVDIVLVLVLVLDLDLDLDLDLAPRAQRQPLRVSKRTRSRQPSSSRRLFPGASALTLAVVGHHHHGGGGHHHHHHHHHGGGGLRGGFGGGWGGPYRHVGASWPLAAVLAILLLGYAAIDGFATYNVYAHGQRGMGVVTHVEDGTTILEVEGRVCAVSGEHGHVGGMLPVAFPTGRPAGCIVRQMTAFRWPGAALLLGGFIIAGILVWRRGATSGTPA